MNLSGQETGYYRFATIWNDRIVFACEDDLWEVPSVGGSAKRLSSGRGEFSLPRISPDGSMIAFVGREEGHPEVFTIPSGGGVPRRLTYLGADILNVVGWSADGKDIHFVADARSAFFRESDGFAISREGGAPREFRWGQVNTFMVDESDRVVIGRNAIDPARWKRYRGGTAGDLWIDPDGKGRFRRLVSLPGNPVWPMLVGERVYFLSDHEGIGNIYSCKPDGKDLRKHTHHTQYYVRFPSTDGRKIAYTAGGDIFVFDPRSEKETRLTVRTPASTYQVQRKFVDARDYTEHFSPHPDGHSVALISRGRVLSMGNWEGPVIQHGEGSRTRYRLVEWAPSGDRFYVINDQDGYERVELHYADQRKEPEFVSSADIGRVVSLKVSPTGDRIAVSNHRHELGVLTLQTKKYAVLDRSPADRITGFSWSPDGRWLAYGWAPHSESSIIRIANVETKKVNDVTDHVRYDGSPVFDPDGKYLYFLGAREFYPVFDSIQFDYGFPRAMKPYLVTLRRDVASPFLAEPKPVVSRKRSAASAQTGSKDEEKGESGDKRAYKRMAKQALSDAYKDMIKKLEKEGKFSRENGASKGPKKVEIDFDGISNRILAFPVSEGRYGQILAAEGRALFTLFPVKGIKPNFNWYRDDSSGGTLMAYDFEDNRSGSLQKDVGSIVIAFDNQTLFYKSNRSIRAVDALEKLSADGREPSAPSGTSRKSGWIDIARAHVLVSPQEEWAQMYNEAWRLQKEQFWDEKMSEIDWDLVHDRYARLLPRVRTRSEVSDLIWEMQGELGTSHAYEFGGDHRRSPWYHQGYLGADLSWEPKRKGYKIDRIIRGDSWDPDVASPLARPGLNVEEGDVIVAINGNAVGKEISIDELLLNQAGNEISLTIFDKKKKSRTVTVKTLSSERALRYRDWVNTNRAYVKEKTKGRIGYLHIPDMGPWGFAEFHRGYLAEVNKEGLIVDVRYNRGGHVSPLLLEKLLRKRVGYDISRWGPPQPYPPESLAGPVVAITNQFAGSDGDIFSHCFKLYKLGPLVGKRTWGGVIGIWPRHRLVDGTITTQPEFSFWFSDVGWGVENYGTDPDYDIDITPDEFLALKDPQMDKSIELVLKSLKEKPVKLPDFTTRPNLMLPGETRKVAKSKSKSSGRKAVRAETRSSRVKTTARSQKVAPTGKSKPATASSNRKLVAATGKRKQAPASSKRKLVAASTKRKPVVTRRRGV